MANHENSTEHGPVSGDPEVTDAPEREDQGELPENASEGAEDPGPRFQEVHSATPEIEDLEIKDAEIVDRDDTPPVAPAPAPEPQRRRGGFMGLLLGGVLAAGAGAYGLYYAQGQGWINGPGGDLSALVAQVDDQVTQIAALQAALDALRAGVQSAQNTAQAGTAALAEQIAALETDAGTLSTGQADLVQSLEGVTTQVGNLTDRLGRLEVQPIPKAELPQEITDAFQRKLDESLANMESQFATIEAAQTGRIQAIEADLTAQMAVLDDTVSARIAALNAAQADAEATKLAAQAAADRAKAQAALLRVTTALDTGAGFAEDLRGISAQVTIPAGLEAAAEGVVPLSQLQNGFAPLARDALAQSREVEPGAGGLSGFLRKQLNTRSLNPQDGGGADAVLSRAEAALKTGALDTVLTELAALPPEGQEPLAEWIGQATALRDAMAGVAELADILNSTE